MTHLRRQFPRWSDFAPFLKFEGPRLGVEARMGSIPTVADMRAVARRRTPRSVFDYVDGSAERELSSARSVDAYRRIEFRPSVLSDVTTVDTSVSILGRRASMPLVLAPTGFTRMMQYEGELAVVRAAGAADVPYALSTMGTTSPEELRDEAATADRWFQLYLWRDRGASSALIERARESGFRVLVLTVDTPVAGARLRDVRHGLTIPPTLTPRTFLEMAGHPPWWFNLLTTRPLQFASLTSSEGSFASMINRVFDPAVGLADLEWLRAEWNGPIVIKGVQTASEAQRVVRAGADAIVLSNHGGRQLDRSATPLEELSDVVDAVGGDSEIYIDGGVTSGADVAGALGLGATACLIGRPYLYGLMAGGEAGVTRVLDIYRDELVRTMQLLGAVSIGDITREKVRLRPQ